MLNLSFIRFITFQFKIGLTEVTIKSATGLFAVYWCNKGAPHIGQNIFWANQYSVTIRATCEALLYFRHILLSKTGSLVSLAMLKIACPVKEYEAGRPVYVRKFFAVKVFPYFKIILFTGFITLQTEVFMLNFGQPHDKFFRCVPHRFVCRNKVFVHVVDYGFADVTVFLSMKTAWHRRLRMVLRK